MKRWPKPPEVHPRPVWAGLWPGCAAILLLGALAAWAQPDAPELPPARETANRAFRLHQYTESRGYLLPILAVDPLNDEVRFQVFLTYLLEGKEEPTQNYVGVLVDPGLPSYHFSRAALHLAKGEYAAADYFVVAAESLFPPEAYLPYEALLHWASWPDAKPKTEEPRYESLIPAGTILEDSVEEPDKLP